MAADLLETSVLKSTLPSEQLDIIEDKARDFACLQGLLMRTGEAPNSSHILTHAPFSLFPTPFPRSLFDKAVKLQASVNELYYKVASDHEFLCNALKSTIPVDEFTAKQWEIYEKVKKAGKEKPIQLALLRSDYMLDTCRGSELELSQVEVNTISSSFLGLSPKVSATHRFVLRQCGLSEADVQRVQLSQTCQKFAEAFIQAWKAYDVPNSVIVMMVDESETNIFDQRWLENTIFELEPGVKLVRKTLNDLGERGQLQDDGRLILDGHEVAVVYYRTGYVPKQFRSEKDWHGKLLADLSKAVVCPSIAWHLAGSKKVQQELTRPGTLERFVSDPETVKAIRSTFVGMYPLDLTPEGDKAVARAIADPERFVMKPQLEGGGNNIYGENVGIKLKELGASKDREAFILMDRIKPHIAKNYAIRRNFPVQQADVVSELGVFGAYLIKNGKVIISEDSGYLLRTKSVSTDEGGVATGASCLDSTYLVDL